MKLVTCLLSVLFALQIIMPPVQAISTNEFQSNSENEVLNRFEQFHQENAYQFSDIQSMQAALDKLTEETDEDELLTILGEPSYQFDIDYSRFYEYYFEHQDQPYVFSIHLYNPLIAYDRAERENRYYLSSYDIFNIGLDSTSVSDLKREDIEKMIQENQDKDFIIEIFVDLLGSPTGYTHYFYRPELKYEWYIEGDSEEDLNYIGIETDDQGNIQEIAIPDVIYDSIDTTTYNP